MWLNCPWWEAATEVPLHFTPPIVAAWRLLTSSARKFVQVTLRSPVTHPLEVLLSDAKLECDGDGALADLNPKGATDMVS